MRRCYTGESLMGKRIWWLGLMACVALMLMAAVVPARAYAATGTYTNLVPTSSDNDEALANKQVTFNGHKWHIIKDDSTGAQSGYVTLLAADTSFGWCKWAEWVEGGPTTITRR